MSREELRAWLSSLGQTWVEDESNADLSNPRNRLRHRVLPELDAAYGGATRPAIARAAELVREDGQWLDESGRAAASSRWPRSCQDGLELDAAALLAEPPPLLRRVLLQAMRTPQRRHAKSGSSTWRRR